MLQHAASVRPGWLSLLVASLMLLAGTATAQAENLPPALLPNRVAPLPGRPPAPRPWSIEVDPSGIEGQAYRAVKITVTSNSGPVTGNRSLRVVIGSNSYDGNNFDEQVTAFIDVPEGQTSATAFVDIPQRRQWHWLHLEFFEDGEPLPHCSTMVSLARTNFRQTLDDCTGVLVISRHAPTRDESRALMTNIASTQSPLKGRHLLPDVRWLVAAIPTNQTNSNGIFLSYTQEKFDDAQLLQTLDKHPGLDLLPPEELSASWLSRSNADLTVISLADLRYLQEKYPEPFEALIRWAMAGGSLVVYGCGDNGERLPELSKLVGLPDDSQPPEESIHWRVPVRSNFISTVQGVVNNNNSGITTYYDSNGAPIANPTQATPLGPDEKPPFTFRRLGMGVLVAYRADNPFPGTPNDWGGLWNTIGSYHFLAARRYGLSFQSRNTDFWNFVIPGVGEAPVFGFMTLIALFMLLIGPVNYHLLKRWRRLSLLLVTVPLGAGLFTLGLFSYAVISDGFSTRTRVRSFTALEPKAERAATMSRQTYYMAFVPSDGMHFPPDTAVFPLHDQPYDVSNGQHWFQSQSRWLDGKLDLQRRYLAAREHRQFIAVRSTATKARLEVKPVGDGLQVHNLLGTHIQLAFLSDARGQLYAVKNLDMAARQKAEPVDSSVARKLWTDRTVSKAPAFPPGFDSNRYTTIFSRRYYSGSQWSGSQASSLLERGIRNGMEELRIPYPQAAPQDGEKSSKEQAFIAITSDSILGSDGQPLAPLGIEGTNVVESLHVVRGSW